MGHLKDLKTEGDSESYAQNFLNFAKSCILSCLIKFDDIKISLCQF